MATAHLVRGRQPGSPWREPFIPSRKERNGV